MYATVQDFQTHYQEVETAELQNIDNETSEPNQRLISALIMAASEINQIIAVRYVLPLMSNVPFLTWANIVIARKNLDSFDEREKTRADYDDIILRLKGIADGEVALVDSLGLPIQQKIDPVTRDNYYHGRMYSGNRVSPVIDFSGKSSNYRRVF